MKQGKKPNFLIRADEVIVNGERVCVPDVDGLREEILREAHNAPYAMHPGTVKMYRNLRPYYWWQTMKKDVAEFVAKCMTCQQVKAEHQAPADRLTKSAHFLPIRQGDSLDKLAELYVAEITDGQSERTIQTLEDMMRACTMEFKGNWDDHLPLMEFAYNKSFHSSISMALYEALYGRRCRSPVYWDIEGLRQLEGPELVQETVEKIQIVKKCLKAAQDWQKSYVDKHRREMEYEIHNVFHVSMLRRYQSDPSHIIREPEIEISEELSYVEEPTEILDRSIRKLRNKEIPMVKVRWTHHSPREATWEVEGHMRQKYPYLFH
ncbi:UNVERIFIED_CONTAM: Transposon Tf2-11 polyprotein [Sesamum latifolium]|uniref:Transposon Tf2-11 polyprotein n=1 Tax=Sesamum latifolium TaxID=2727402 RepID=A0AAW2TDW2_9LAMI